MSKLSSTVAALNNRSGILVRWVVDVTDPNSSSELKLAAHTRRREFELNTPILEQVILPCGLYNTHNAAFSLLKAAQPVPAIHYPESLVFLNVAEIAEQEDGIRKDHLVVAVSKSGALIVGYAAERSPILDQVLPYLDELYTFQTPAEWAKHQTFRSRNILPRVAFGLIAQDATVLQGLTRIELDAARDQLGITHAKRECAGWFDGFGQELDRERQYNLKTAFEPRQIESQDVRYGDTVEVVIEGEVVAEALYARSLQASDSPGKLILCQGSSGYIDREGIEHRFLDLMAYGASAYAAIKENLPADTPLDSSTHISFRAKAHVEGNGRAHAKADTVAVN